MFMNLGFDPGTEHFIVKTKQWKNRNKFGMVPEIFQHKMSEK